MKSNLTTKEKEKILRNTIAEWKKEYKAYQTMLNIYLWIILVPFAFMCFVLYRFDALVGYICTVITSFYTILAIVPTVDELGKINKCNVKNIRNIKVGVIRRKYYRQRKFSIYLADITKYREIDIVRVTTSQFDKFRVSDTIIYFEFYPRRFCDNIHARRTI